MLALVIRMASLRRERFGPIRNLVMDTRPSQKSFGRGRCFPLLTLNL